MQDIIEQIRSYLFGIWRYRWYSMGIVWLVCLIAWPLILLKLPDQNQASTRVSVDTNVNISPFIKGQAPFDIEVLLVEMTRNLLSYSNLESIAQHLINSTTDMAPSDDTRAMVAWLRNGLKLEGVPRDGKSYQLSFSGENPELAREVVKLVTDLFRDKVPTVVNQYFDPVEKFLNQGIVEQEAIYQNAQNKLAEFKRQYSDVLLVAGQTYFTQIGQSEADLKNMELELQTAKAKLDGRAITPEPAISFEAYKESMIREGRMSEWVIVQRVRDELNQLATLVTPSHPDFLFKKNELNRLEANFEVRVRERYQAEHGTVSGIDPNGEQRRRLQFDIKILEGKINEQKLLIATLKEKQSQLPSIQVELSKLEGEVASAKMELDNLKNQERQIKAQKEIIKYEGINVKNSPISVTLIGPNRPVFISGALVFGVGLGLALAFLIFQLRPTFSTRRSIMAVTHIPVLGSVGAILSPARARRQRLELFLYCCLLAGLFAIYASLILFDFKGLSNKFI